MKVEEVIKQNELSMLQAIVFRAVCVRKANGNDNVEINDLATGLNWQEPLVVRLTNELVSKGVLGLRQQVLNVSDEVDIEVKKKLKKERRKRQVWEEGRINDYGEIKMGGAPIWVGMPWKGLIIDFDQTAPSASLIDSMREISKKVKEGSNIRKLIHEKNIILKQT